MTADEEKFLVDSNSFITPYRFYYAFDIAPNYWSILAQKASEGRIVLLDKVNN